MLGIRTRHWLKMFAGGSALVVFHGVFLDIIALSLLLICTVNSSTLGGKTTSREQQIPHCKQGCSCTNAPGSCILVDMQEIIALLAPSLIAVGFYNHLYRNALPARRLVSAYGLFVVLINLCMYLITVYILQVEQLAFGEKEFIRYLIGASVMALLLPFVVNLIEHMFAIEVKKNIHDKK